MELVTFSTGYKTLVAFKMKTIDSSAFSPFSYNYETGSGETKRTPFPTLQNHGDYFKVSYVFEDDINDTIILKRTGQEMPILELQEAIRIRIEVPEVFLPLPTVAP